MLTKSSLIADFILGEILSGRFRPGDRLPSRNQLTRQFHCSRNSVERAMASLAASGNITSVQGGGTFVAAPAPEEGIRELRIISHWSPYLRREDAPMLIPSGEFADLSVRWIRPNCAGENLEQLSCPGGAVIWVMPSLESIMMMRHLQARGIPQLLINREFEGFDCITTDPYASIREGLEWLTGSGAGPVAFIGTRPDEERPFQSGRIIAFFEAAVSLGAVLAPEGVHLLEPGRTSEELAAAAEALWGGRKTPPPGLFVLDQEIAAEVCRLAEGFGRRPGRDFPMLVFDAPEKLRQRPGIALMRQAYGLFGEEFARWLRRGGTVRGRPFRRKLKTDLLVNG